MPFIRDKLTKFLLVTANKRIHARHIRSCFRYSLDSVLHGWRETAVLHREKQRQVGLWAKGLEQKPRCRIRRSARIPWDRPARCYLQKGLFSFLFPLPRPSFFDTSCRVYSQIASDRANREAYYLFILHDS